MRRRFRPVAGLVVAALLALCGVLASATAASAHDELESTTPKQGSTVATPPPSITLTFNQPAFKLGSRIRVVGPAGDVAQGQPVFRDQTVRQPIRPDAPAGDYTVQWQVTSTDGHPIAGTWAFSVATAGVVPTIAPPTASATTPSTTPPEPTAATLTAGSVSGSDEDDSSGSTGLVVALTTIAALVLLAAAGAVAWASRRRPG